MESQTIIEQRVQTYFATGENNCAMTVLKVLSELFDVPVEGQVVEAAQAVVGMKTEINRIADSAALHETRRLVAEERGIYDLGVRVDGGVGLLFDLSRFSTNNLMRLEIAWPDDGGPYVVSITGGESPADVREALANLDANETSTAIRRGSTQLLVMLCGRTTEASEADRSGRDPQQAPIRLAAAASASGSAAAISSGDCR